ncbi:MULTISPECIES: ABC transporter permease [unclassified Blastococcus]
MSRGVPFSAVVGSEWTKLRSTRSTWWCSALFVLLAGGAGWLAAATTQAAPRADLAVSSALTGFGFGPVPLVVLGVLVVSSEFRTGLALATFTAVPRRGRLLLAKTVVVVAWSVLLTAVVAAFCLLAATRLTAVPGGIPPTDADVLRQLWLQVAGAALTGVLAVGLGAVLRSSAGALGAALALVLVLPPVLAIAGTELSVRVSRWLPAFRVGEDAFLAAATSWQTGLLVAGAWAAAAWLLGAALLVRRDV